jgi:hypothetical protein
MTRGVAVTEGDLATVKTQGLTADAEYVRIVDYLELYIKEYVLGEEIYDDYED